VSIGIDIPGMDPPGLVIPDMPDIPDIPGIEPDIPGIEFGAPLGAGEELADEAVGGAVEKSQPGFGSTDTSRSEAPSANTIRRPVVEMSERSSGTRNVRVVSCPAGTVLGVTVTWANATEEAAKSVPAVPSTVRNTRRVVRRTKPPLPEGELCSQSSYPRTPSPQPHRQDAEAFPDTYRTIDVVGAGPLVPKMIMTETRGNRSSAVINVLAEEVPAG